MAIQKVSSWGQLYEFRPAADGATGHVDRRNWQRFDCDLETTCQPAGATDTETFVARVRNIARGGLNLVLPQAVPVGTVLRIDLQGVTDQELCTVLGCVVHTAETEAGAWSVGCSFVSELSDDDLTPFGARRERGTDSDQRAWVRYACDLQGSYRVVRVTERTQSPARVLDISACGVGLEVDRQLDVGTVLSVDLRDAGGKGVLKIFACVVRATSRGDGRWAVGCNFIRQLGEKELEGLKPAGAI